MQDEKTHGLTRRSFIKGAATLTAAGALVGCSPKAENLEEVKEPEAVPADEIYTGVCRGNCFGGCKLDVHVRDGQIVRTTAGDMPDPQYNRVCSKGLTHMYRTYSANRVQYPMKRVGERGEGEFERISWDEALDEISSKWSSYREEFGPESIMLISQSGNLSFGGGIHGIGAYLSRFANIMGFSKANGNLDWAAVASNMIACGGQDYWGAGANEPTDYKNADTFVCWGANPAVSQPHNMHFIEEAHEAGTHFIVIDPVFNMTAARADKFIPINATTDAALAMGLINEVVSNGWHDVEFLRDHTEAPLLVKEDGSLLKMSDFGVEPTEGDIDPATGKPSVVDPYVVWDEETGDKSELAKAKNPAIEGVSEVEGIPVKTTFDYLMEIAAQYPLEEVERITGVSVADAKALAEVYKKGNAVSTYMQYGQDHYSNGHYACWAIFALGMVSGQIGKPGAFAGVSCIAVIGLFNLAVSMAQDSNGQACQGLGRTFNLDRIGDIQQTGICRDEPLVLKGLYVMGANPISVYAEQRYVKDVFSKLEFIVVAEQSMTDTAKWADILLPAADWYEQTDMYAACGTHPYLLWNEKAIEPLYESKTDFEIYKLLLDKMGLGDFWGWESGEDALAEYLESDALREMGISLDRLKEEKALRVVPGDVFLAYEGGAYLTPTQRGRFYQEAPFVDTEGYEVDLSKERAPHWELPFEADANCEVRATYPFHCLSDHMRTRTHTQWWDVDLLDEVETTPVVKMNPEDAAELDIVEGDKVKLFNDRGYVVLNAVVNAGLPRKTISVPRGFQQSEFIDGHIASLPVMKFNQACANQPFNDVAVAIEKA